MESKIDLPPEPGTVPDECLGVQLDMDVALAAPENDKVLGEAEMLEGDDDDDEA